MKRGQHAEGLEGWPWEWAGWLDMRAGNARGRLPDRGTCWQEAEAGTGGFAAPHTGLLRGKADRERECPP